MMEFVIDWQNASEFADLPTPENCQQWLETASQHVATGRTHLDANEPIELTLRFADAPEVTELNATYRDKNSPTNVLSFPFEAPQGVPMNLLGDLVFCPEVVAHEAQNQSKEVAHHWAHMVIHGFLHLWGYDHIKEADAQVMEALEITILAELAIADPYLASE